MDRDMSGQDPAENRRGAAKEVCTCAAIDEWVICWCHWCRLEEAEERYHNREPRDEDLMMNDQLKGAIHRLEASVKQLTVSFVVVTVQHIDIIFLCVNNLDNYLKYCFYAVESLWLQCLHFSFYHTIVNIVCILLLLLFWIMETW